MAVETLDRRTALEEAFDSAEADAKGEVYTPPVHEEAPAETTESETPDPAVVESKATDQSKTKDRQRTRGVPLDERVKHAEGEQPEGTETKVAPKAASNLDKAPLSWGPQRDSLWAKTPPEVRAITAKREADIQAGMSQAGTVRKIAEEYHSVIMPFENIIRSMGTTPRQALTDVMTTASALIVGNQAQKVAVVAEMIQRYGVDLPSLDKAMTDFYQKGGAKPNGRGLVPEPQMDPRILQSLQPLFQMQKRLQEAEGQKHEQLTQEAAQAINSMVDKPYFEDVKADIADIMEISANRGHIMTIQQAYDKACQIHPEISKLVAQSRSTPTNAVARARRASSTVKGAPGGAVNSGKMDRRAALEAAWNSAG
jgi:hypothetical protein